MSDPTRTRSHWWTNRLSVRARLAAGAVALALVAITLTVWRSPTTQETPTTSPEVQKLEAENARLRAQLESSRGQRDDIVAINQKEEAERAAGAASGKDKAAAERAAAAARGKEKAAAERAAAAARGRAKAAVERAEASQRGKAKGLLERELAEQRGR